MCGLYPALNSSNRGNGDEGGLPDGQVRLSAARSVFLASNVTSFSWRGIAVLASRAPAL